MEIGSNRVASEKTAEAEITETPPPIRVQNAKPLSFSSNGVLKRHNPLHHHHHRSFVGSHHRAAMATYKECLKNHAASLGGHAVDGCGEFMPSPTAAANPTLLKCAACGCHRNFHRREPDETTLPKSAVSPMEYQSHHRHRPPPPPPPPNHGSPNNSPSPPPISSSYYPSAPHMLLALSTGFSGPPTDNNTQIPTNLNSRKRFRTKFTQDQKDKMLEFAEKVGWKIQKRDEELINEFCTQVGVERGVLKVWMHNNKSTLCKRDQSNAVIDNVNGRNNHNSESNAAAPHPTQFNLHQGSSNNSDNVNVAVNGSSSSL